MKLFNKAGERFSDFFGVSDEESDAFVDEEVMIDEEPSVLEPEPNIRETNNLEDELDDVTSMNHAISHNEEEPEKNVKISETENQYTNKKVVEMNTYQHTSNGNKRMVVARQHRKVSVYEPRDYIDCKQIAQALFRKEIIILSFKLMNESSARRVVDFMTGTVYAIDGDIQRLGDEMFICTPANVDVDSSITRNIITNHLTEY